MVRKEYNYNVPNGLVCRYEQVKKSKNRRRRKIIKKEIGKKMVVVLQNWWRNPRSSVRKRRGRERLQLDFDNASK